MKETAAAVQPGTAALFVLVRKVTADKVLDRLKGEGGTVLKTSLDHTKEAALQAAWPGQGGGTGCHLICRAFETIATPCRRSLSMISGGRRDDDSLGMTRVRSQSSRAMPSGSTPILDHQSTSLPARCSSR